MMNKTQEGLVVLQISLGLVELQSLAAAQTGPATALVRIAQISIARISGGIQPYHGFPADNDRCSGSVSVCSHDGPRPCGLRAVRAASRRERSVSCCVTSRIAGRLRPDCALPAAAASEVLPDRRWIMRRPGPQLRAGPVSRGLVAWRQSSPTGGPGMLPVSHGDAHDRMYARRSWRRPAAAYSRPPSLRKCLSLARSSRRRRGCSVAMRS